MRAAARAYTGDKQVTELSLPFGIDETDRAQSK